MANRKGGRTMRLIHKGRSVIVKEDHEGNCVIEFEDHQQPSEKGFPAACREALTWLLKNAGAMRGDYTRKDTR